LLVGLVVIDAEFGMNDHGSIPAIAIGKGWNQWISKLIPEPD
jgi:hypothetical protein